MQKDIFTRIKIIFVKLRDTYFTGVERIFRYCKRLEAKLDDLENALKNLEHSNYALKVHLNNEIQKLKIDSSLLHLEEKFKPTQNFNPELFILFDYAHHIHRNYHNLGDFVQSLAVKRILESLDYNHFEFFDRDSLSFYPSSEGGGICIMQGWFALSYDFLPPSNILPVFVGTHFTAYAQNFLKHFIARFPHYFKDKECGCRDVFTLNFLQKMGIKSYFSRCLTLTLPKREPANTQNQIFLVDLDDKIKALLPKNLKDKGIEINQRWINLSAFETFSQEFYLKFTQELLNRYKNEAKLIITTALHCAAPCVALGIPVILIANNAKEQLTRFTALKGILPLYTFEDLEQGRVDFSPQELDIEELKENMLLNLKLSILKAQGKMIDENLLLNTREKIANFNLLKQEMHNEMV
ncbi:polysaccharide pyruvyl transferase family protein [Campylobacter cuniculorum]|nr:polysaccharide pyruvyl transferase family protein [Campylobacter cuniculorum]ARJ57287.1 putative polysaccharide pyruvyl transferase [Campylobacter cuniculorum DSM 23162 = LMG 24588]